MKTSPKDWCSFYLWHKIRQWKNASYLILWGHCCFKCAWRTALSVENTKWLCSITLCWRVAFVRNLYRSASKRVELKDSVTRIQTNFFRSIYNRKNKNYMHIHTVDAEVTYTILFSTVPSENREFYGFVEYQRNHHLFHWWHWEIQFYWLTN